MLGTVAFCHAICAGMSANLFPRSCSPAERSQAGHDVLIRKVGDSPVDLARRKNAIIPRAAVAVGIQALGPEVSEIPEFNSQRSASGTPPPMKLSVGRKKESLTIPAVRRRRTGRQHVRRRVENRPLQIMLRAVNDQILVGLVRALAPGASAEDVERRADQVPVIQIEQQHVCRSALHVERSVIELRS